MAFIYKENKPCINWFISMHQVIVSHRENIVYSTPDHLTNKHLVILRVAY